MVAFAVSENFEVTNPERMAAYSKANGPLLTKHGGKVIGRGPGRPVEGDWAPKGLVIIQFDSMEALENWYNSPEYQELVKERQASSRGQMTFIDGA
ncbi:MAG: DUF1330 domain-containing protein [Rhodospirillales bacterium]|nr:DUF1330 domain-containing protein [Rhodospirillales bacterium]